MKKETREENRHENKSVSHTRLYLTFTTSEELFICPIIRLNITVQHYCEYTYKDWKNSTTVCLSH